MNLKLQFLFLVIATFGIELNNAHDKIVYCYFGSWSVYRTGNGQFLIEDMDPFQCTHIAYTFIGLNPDGSIDILDKQADLPDGYDGYNKLNSLRKKNPALKTLISIGGWNQGSTTYSQVFSSPVLRKRFVSNAVAFVKQYGFNGMDLDWEYPNQRGGVQADVNDFTEVLKELKDAFTNEGFVLSVALAAAKNSASQSYDIKSISQYADIMNLMTYDFHIGTDSTIGLNSPLYPRSTESADEKANLNVKACLDYWIAQGAAPEKLMIGIPAYGHTYKISNPSKITPGSPSAGAGISGPYTQTPGLLGFNEYCEQIKGKKGWDEYYDSEQRAPYAVKKSDWVGFDNATSVAEKTNMAISYNLGGAMVWSIETDDFHAFCGVKYGVLQAINDAFNGK